MYDKGCQIGWPAENRPIGRFQEALLGSRHVVKDICMENWFQTFQRGLKPPAGRKLQPMAQMSMRFLWQ